MSNTNQHPALNQHIGSELQFNAETVADALTNTAISYNTAHAAIEECLALLEIAQQRLMQMQMQMHNVNKGG